MRIAASARCVHNRSQNSSLDLSVPYEVFSNLAARRHSNLDSERSSCVLTRRLPFLATTTSFKSPSQPLGFKSDKLKPLTGKSLGEVARMLHTSPEDTAMDLVVEDDSRVETVYFLMGEETFARGSPCLGSVSPLIPTRRSGWRLSQVQHPPIPSATSPVSTRATFATKNFSARRKPSAK